MLSRCGVEVSYLSPGAPVSQQFLRWISIKPEEEDTHDDFKPIIKAQPDSGVEETIKSDITTNKVFVYMKVRFAPAETRVILWYMATNAFMFIGFQFPYGSVR